MSAALVSQRGAACGRARFYPRVPCAARGGTALEWRRPAVRGTVDAVTVVRRPPALEPDLPYAIALVNLDVQMMANVLGGDPEAVAIGDRVRATFERRGEAALPQFTRLQPFSKETRS